MRWSRSGRATKFDPSTVQFPGPRNRPLADERRELFDVRGFPAHDDQVVIGNHSIGCGVAKVFAWRFHTNHGDPVLLAHPGLGQRNATDRLWRVHLDDREVVVELDKVEHAAADEVGHTFARLDGRAAGDNGDCELLGADLLEGVNVAGIGALWGIRSTNDGPLFRPGEQLAAVAGREHVDAAIRQFGGETSAESSRCKGRNDLE